MSGPERRMSYERTSRQVAAVAGRAAERLTGLALEQLEGLSLWALEQAAASRPGDDDVRTAEERLRRLRARAVPLPRLARRVVAGSTYFGLRWGREIAHAAREIKTETSAFLNADAEPQED